MRVDSSSLWLSCCEKSTKPLQQITPPLQSIQQIHELRYHIGDGVEEHDGLDGPGHHLQRPLLHAQHVVKPASANQAQTALSISHKRN